MRYIVVDTNRLVTDETVENLADFIPNCPTLSNVRLAGGLRGKADILLLAAAKNESIKKVDPAGLSSKSGKEARALIALLNAGHVETLILENIVPTVLLTIRLKPLLMPCSGVKSFLMYILMPALSSPVCLRSLEMVGALK